MRRLWYNGTVASMDGAMRRYEAVGAEDGRLTFLGERSGGSGAGVG